MDPVTAFAIATLMMLLNGGVLGLVHNDLPAGLHPSARSWRIATLLMAAGCVLLAVREWLPPVFVQTLANGLLMLGLAGYWHSLRQFYGLPARAALLLPVALGTVGVYLFTAWRPDPTARVLLASAVWTLLLAGAVATLRRDDRATSRRVLAAVFLVTLTGVAARAAAWVSPAAAPLLEGRTWFTVLDPLVVTILPVIGTTAFLLLCSDRIRRQWEHAASTDNLTGLANRRVLAGEGARLLQQAIEGDDALSVAVVDVDHFKQLNDTFGHDTGDVALRHVADCLRRACDDGHLPARQGGEEFVVLLPQARADDAHAAAERIRQAIEAAPLAVREGQTRRITVSIGLATLQPGDRQFDDLLRRADRGLYAAKSAGRNRVAAAM